MKIESDKVYLYRVPIDTTEVPFEQYRDLAREALSRIDLDLPEQGTILLKPNITIAVEPETRIITHPGFIAGMLQALVDKGVPAGRLDVAEGAGRKDKEYWAKVSGYTDALEAFGLTLTDLNQSDGVQIEAPGGVVHKQFRMSHQVTECAFFFDVPVAKCHNLAFTTLSIKNLQGTVLSPQRHLCTVQDVDEPLGLEALARLGERGLSLHEERFCNKLSDLLSARRNAGIPRLSMIDGMIGRDGTAFREGRNHPLGWTLIGENEVHVDAVATYLFGLDPEKVPYLQIASERGLGTCRIEEIEAIDLSTGERLDHRALEALRADPVLMPVSRYSGGYYARFRPDGSVAPWAIDRVNQQREKDGLEPIPVTPTSSAG